MSVALSPSQPKRQPSLFLAQATTGQSPRVTAIPASRQEEAQLAGIRQGLLEGLAQAKAGDLAEGTGEDAIRRSFAKARAAS